MKIIFFSLALICATSLISNDTETVRRAADAVKTCAICPVKCEFCGKEIHEDGNDVDADIDVDGEEEGAEAKCGCGNPRPPRN